MVGFAGRENSCQTSQGATLCTRITAKPSPSMCDKAPAPISPSPATISPPPAAPPAQTMQLKR
ncbi:hypothetical protein D8779_09035 [Pseudomonas leptonychotis]|uniref:Uncharacterized protein n=1 Tax=Pseudomonas leptonychotis TaxID=2448482 RepID=A0A4T2A1A7_9PSED|nr:hypothetical protein D8779_09035 [Pseudomonas leptonychotis]